MRIPTGVLIPETVLQSHWFSILAAFVAINTVIYLVLGVSKMVPAWKMRSVKFTDESLSIYPERD